MDFDIGNATAVLQRTPGTLRALLDGLSPAWTDADEGPETWSPTIILGHLIYSERANWIPRARAVLEQSPERRFTPFDRMAQFRESAGKPPAVLLDEFAELRAANLATLAEWRLTEAQLALQGEHPQFGVVTLRQLLSTWTAHDLAHLGQIARVMAKQYRDAVGPWRAFLPILDR